MRIERLFNVLVLGGAALGAGCGHDDSNEGEATEPSTNAGSGSGGMAAPNAGGAAGTSAPNGGSSNVGGTGNAGSANGGAMAKGGANEGGAGATSSGGSADGGTAGTSAGAAMGGAGLTGSGGAAGGRAAGSGGTGGDLACRLDPLGRGDPRDPCGCPCCWTVDCLNTDEGCCAGFCNSGDEGRGCCGQ